MKQRTEVQGLRSVRCAANIPVMALDISVQALSQFKISAFHVAKLREAPASARPPSEARV